MYTPDDDRLAELDRRNAETIARISDARLNPPLLDETPEEPEIDKCEDCQKPLPENYGGDICEECALKVQLNKQT